MFKKKIEKEPTVEALEKDLSAIMDKKNNNYGDSKKLDYEHNKKLEEIYDTKRRLDLKSYEEVIDRLPKIDKQSITTYRLSPHEIRILKDCKWAFRQACEIESVEKFNKKARGFWERGYTDCATQEANPLYTPPAMWQIEVEGN